MSTSSAQRFQAVESTGVSESGSRGPVQVGRGERMSEKANGLSRGGANDETVEVPVGVLERIRGRLTRQVGPQRFERYFGRQARLTVTPQGVDVTVPSRFMAELLDRQFGAVLREVIRAEWPVGSREREAVEGRLSSEDEVNRRLHYRVDTGAFGGAPSSEDSGSPAAVGAHAGVDARLSVGASGRPGPGTRAGLRGRARLGSGSWAAGSSRFCFETFVVGASNRLAYAAAVKIAESSDAREFNRVFIQGPCGLGKTHLLRATLARFKDCNPTALVCYTTAEEFTNEYITAVRTNKIDAFRKQFRRVDLLCLDDVHFLSRKDKTQSELQHTFDTLDLDGARLVLASDELPRDISSLSEQLVSRFLSGAVVRLDPPDRELRERLVKAIAARRGLRIDDSAAAALAQHGTGPGMVSVRELEGSMVQVEAMLRLAGPADGSAAITAGLVHRALGGMDKTPSAAVRSGRPIPFQIVIAEVCRELKVDLAAFTGTGRHPRVVLARCVCGHLGRELTTLSFPEIARHMGRPTHSTIISGCKRLKARLAIEAGGAKDLSLEFGAEFAGSTLAELIDRTIRVIARAAEKF